MVSHCGDVALVDKRNRSNNTSKPQEVESTGDVDRLLLRSVEFQVHLGLALVVVAVDKEEEDQQHCTYKCPLGQQAEEPSKLSTTQIEEEQWWITQRSQQTTAVCHQADKEQDGVYLVLTLLVNLDKGTDEQHRCTGSTHNRRQHEAECEKRGVGSGLSLNIATDVDTACHYEECAEQDDEGNIVEQHLVLEVATHTCANQVDSGRNTQNERHDKFIAIALPPMLFHQRDNRNAEQHQQKGNQCPNCNFHFSCFLVIIYCFVFDLSVWQQSL